METYGDLKKAIKSIQLKQKGEKVGKVTVDVILGAIPGLGAAKSTFDVLSAAFRKPDTKKSNSWLDKLDIDDEMEAIVDDTVENGFLKFLSKAFDSESDDKPLEQDFNMNAKMVDYLKKNYKQRTVTGISEQKSVFDKFFTKFAYKFDKGYPDMNNDQDVLLLESLISELTEEQFNLKEITDAEEGLEILKKELDLPDDKYLRKSGVQYRILVPRSQRNDYINKMSAIDGFEYDGSMSGSSIGGMRYKGARFLIKPEGLQGRNAPGLGNEDVLVKNVRKYLDEGAKNVIFKGENKNYVCKDIIAIDDVGYDVTSGKKADVILRGENKDYPISIKALNAGFWESADRRYKPVLMNLLDKINDGDIEGLGLRPYLDVQGNEKKGIFVMYDIVTDKKISGVIVTDLPDSQEESIIFGSDKCVVIYGTYTDNSFKLVGEDLIITVGKILTDMSDVEKYNLEPVLNIRHDSTRQGQRGLRSIVEPEILVYKGKDKPTGNRIELSYNELIQ